MRKQLKFIFYTFLALGIAYVAVVSYLYYELQEVYAADAHRHSEEPKPPELDTE